MTAKDADEAQVLSARMIRAARSLLNMSQAHLAKEVGVTKRTIIRHEDEARTDARRGDVQRKIREVLEEDHDVEFIFADGKKGEGVRLRRIL